MTLKVTYSDFEKVTRSSSFADFISSAEIYRLGAELISRTDIGRRTFRLLGLTVSNLEGDEQREITGPRQLSFWGDDRIDGANANLNQSAETNSSQSNFDSSF